MHLQRCDTSIIEVFRVKEMEKLCDLTEWASQAPPLSSVQELLRPHWTGVTGSTLSGVQELRHCVFLSL